MPTKDEVAAFILKEFPHTKIEIEEVGGRGATVSHPISERELRPGRTVSGPLLMMVADVALYIAILGEIGIVPLAVTTNLTINFLRRPAAGMRITAVAKLLKVGRALAVGEVLLYSDGTEEPVAHAIGTYSIPRER